MKKIIFSLAALSVLFAAACTKVSEPNETSVAESVKTYVTVNCGAVKSYLGPSVDGVRKMYWEDGDMISINGVASEPLTDVPANATSATFAFTSALEYPYKVVFPAKATTEKSLDGSKVFIISPQNYTESSFDSESAVSVGYAENESSSITLTPVCAVLKLSISASRATALDRIYVGSRNEEQIRATFNVDSENLTIASASTALAAKYFYMKTTGLMIDSTPTEIFINVPAGTYSKGFTFAIQDADGNCMSQSRTSSTTLEAGKVYNLPAINFVPNQTISTADELMAFATAVNNGDYDGFYGTVKLGADIDLAGKTWVSIGKGPVTTSGVLNGKSFKGIFDGQNHTIDNLTQSISGSTVGTTAGLFGVLSHSGTIKNVIMGSGCSITGACTKESYIGGVVGFLLQGTVDHCTNNGSYSLTAKTDNIREVLGGIVGQAYTKEAGNTISYCTNNGTLTSTNTVNTKNGGTGLHLGGIVGFVDASSSNITTVKNCTNEANITAQATRLAGIVASSNKNTTIQDCVNNGNISDTDVKASNSRVAGITSAFSNDVKLTRCVNNGDIAFAVAENQTQGYAGGIAGQANNTTNTVTIDSCENYGTVRSDMYYLANETSSTIKYMGIILANPNSKTLTIKYCKVGGKIGPWKDESALVTITSDNYSSFITLPYNKFANVTFTDNVFATKPK